MNEIHESLYQGNLEDAERASQGDFGYIVYVGQGLSEKLSYESKIPIIHIPIRDGKDNAEKLRLVADVMELLSVDDENPTLVACRAGVSRSPTMILFYLTRHCGYPFDDAWKEVEDKIPEYQPNQDLLSATKEVLTE